MPTLAQLLAADRRIQATITRMEGAPKRPKARKGWRVILPKRDRVAGDITRTVTWPRYLVWQSYFASRKPTQASMVRMAHRMRGYGLYYYALWAEAHGHPLPTDHTPPASALRPQHTHTRAADDGMDDNPYADAFDPAYDVSDEAAAWWDEQGWDAGLPAVPMTPEERATWEAETLAQVTQSLDFDTWLNNNVLGDLQVLQILETYWNGQTTMFSGQETLGEMGIAGDFNLVDPFAMDFLRYQSGIFVKGMATDEKTRQQLAEALWSGWGGDAAEGVGPFGIPQLAKYIQGTMQAQENSLMDMSRTRAYLIAVTETARAETFGQFVSMLGTGVQRKVWMITTGACLICEGNQSMGDIPILDLFPSGHYAPPGHPRCRCSLAPYVGDTFNPKDWMFAPSADQLQRLFKDPSFAQWPNQSVDLTHPELQLTPPGPAVLGDFGRLPYSSLPDGLQQVIDPTLYANNYTDAWNAILRGVGQSVNHAAQADQSTKVAEEAAYFTPSGSGGTALTLDDILGAAGDTPPDMADFTAQLRQALDDALGNLGDDLPGLGGDGE